MEYNLKRPKRINEEDEDELLRFQEEFLKNKSSQQPAAKVVKRETTVIDESQKGNKLTDKKSKFHIDCNLIIYKLLININLELTVLSFLSSRGQKCL